MKTIFSRLVAHSIISLLLLAVGAIAQAQPFAYVASSGTNVVQKIDTSSNTLAGTIGVGVAPFGVAVTNDGTKVYVANYAGNSVSVIDTATQTVVATIPVMNAPYGVAVNAAGTRVYVAHYEAINKVSVIDTATNTVLTTVTVGSWPNAIAVNPAGTLVYVTNDQNGDNSVSVINTTTNAVIATIPVGANPRGVAFSPNGSYAYVSNYSSNSISVISTTTHSVVATIATPTGPYGMAISADGLKLYVANYDNNSLSVINAATHTLFTTITGIAANPQGVALNPAGTYAYVATTIGTNRVYVVSLASYSVLTTLTVPSGASGVGNFIQPPLASLVAPTISSSAPAGGAINTAYSHQFTANGTAPFDWSVLSGSLPTGLTLNALTGKLSGTPTTAGNFSFTVQAANGTIPDATQVVSITIGAPPFIATVTSTADSGVGSLRQALLDVQTNCAATTKIINFNIAGGGPHVISPLTDLPNINCANTTIDGYSQPGSSANTLAQGNNAELKIHLDGLNSGAVGSGLIMSADNIVVRGLAISRFSSSGINTLSATNSKIIGNFIGTNVTGDSASGNSVGIRAVVTSNVSVAPSGSGEKSARRTKAVALANGLLIGTASPADRNVISGNTLEGINVFAPNTVVTNNYIGTDKTGGSALPNGGRGIKSNWAGTNILIQNNIVSFNDNHGIVVGADSTTITGNTIQSNSGMGVYVPGTECGPDNTFIRQNNIGVQGSLGIDLGNVFQTIGTRDILGATLSPNSDNCYHANRGLNSKAPGYPVVNAIIYEWTGANVTTTINADLQFASVLGVPFNIDLFDNSTIALDSANKGVGNKYVASTTTPATDGSGTAAFQITHAEAVYHPTMTASPPITGNSSGTSEFSLQKVSPLAYTSTYNNFAIVAGGSQSQSFAVQNTSGTTQDLSPTSNLAAFVVVADAGCSSLAPGNSCNFNVTYSRATAGTDVGVLSVIIGDVTYKWNLVGAATAFALPTFGISLGSTVVAGNAMVFSFRVGNAGGNPTVSGVSAAITFPSGFVHDVPNISYPQAAANSFCSGSYSGYVAGGNQFAFSSGTVQPGVTCNIASSQIIAPSTPGVYTFSIPAGGFAMTSPFVYSNPSPITFAVTVNPVGGGTAPAITSAAPSGGLVGAGYSFTPAASGTTPITWSIPSGSLPPGLSLNATTGTISGSPTAAGTYTFTLRATNGAGQANQATSISITAPLGPIINLSIGSIDFGTQAVDTNSAAMVVILANSGSLPMLISSVVVSGDFNFVSNCPLSPNTLAAGASCNISIRFNPLTANQQTGFITVSTNSLSGGNSILLYGTGVIVPRANINLTETVLAFGDQAVGSTSNVRSVIISNTGLATLELRNITLSAGAFQRVPQAAVPVPPNPPIPSTTLNCGFSLASATSCYISIVFAPGVTGNANAVMTISHNGTASGSATTSAVSLTGNGTPRPEPIIRVASGVDFGSQVLDTVSSPQQLSITNIGTANLAFGGFATSPANPATQLRDFTFGINNCGSTLIPNASCTLSVSFSPTATIGTKLLNLDINSNAANASIGRTRITLAGNAEPVPIPIVNLSATTIGFGNTFVGMITSGQRITVTNVGQAPLNLTSISITGDFSQTNTCPTPLNPALNPGQNCIINILFSPRGLGSQIGSLIIKSNATPDINTVSLTGRGCFFLAPRMQRFFVSSCGN